MNNHRTPTIETLLCSLDKWRHFAGYPLETRVDALMGLFLPKAMETLLRVQEIQQQAIPQFPLKKEATNRSYKADFFALSSADGRAFLIELKTDMSSRRKRQTEYLQKARKRGLPRILKELKEVAENSKGSYRRKYLKLLDALTEMGLLQLPSELVKMIRSGKTRVPTELIHKVEISQLAESRVEVVLVQPRRDESEEEKDFHYIYFNEFAESIQCSGELGSLLAHYLRRWEEDPAPRKS